MVGGSYDAGFVKGYARYGRAKTDITHYEGKTSSLGVLVPVDVGFILFDVARTKVTTAAPYSGTRTTASLGYDYFLSKRTDALQDRVTALERGNTLGLGVRHRF